MFQFNLDLNAILASLKDIFPGKGKQGGLLSDSPAGPGQGLGMKGGKLDIDRMGAIISRILGGGKSESARPAADADARLPQALTRSGCAASYRPSVKIQSRTLILQSDPKSSCPGTRDPSSARWGMRWSEIATWAPPSPGSPPTRTATGSGSGPPRILRPLASH